MLESGALTHAPACREYWSQGWRSKLQGWMLDLAGQAASSYASPGRQGRGRSETPGSEDLPPGKNGERGWPLAALERPGVHEFLGGRGANRAAALSLLLCAAASLPCAAERRLVWVQTSAATRRWGLPCGEGLDAIGLNPRNLLLVESGDERELLWALEQALDCPGLLAVVGCLPSVERHYGFTASRRLSLRALRNGSRVFLARGARIREATSAQTRWRVDPWPSVASGLVWRGFELPGARSWRVGLKRASGWTPGAWNIEWSENENRLRLAASPARANPVRAAG